MKVLLGIGLLLLAFRTLDAQDDSLAGSFLSGMCFNDSKKRAVNV